MFSVVPSSFVGKSCFPFADKRKKVRWNDLSFLMDIICLAKCLVKFTSSYNSCALILKRFLTCLSIRVISIPPIWSAATIDTLYLGRIWKFFLVSLNYKCCICTWFCLYIEPLFWVRYSPLANFTLEEFSSKINLFLAFCAHIYVPNVFVVYVFDICMCDDLCLIE